MIEFYLNEFKDAGISIQITQDIGSLATVHAFDEHGELHKTESEILTIALEKMKRKLI
ncbi:hypothetical protein [Oceanobacillus sp. FSL H7-0719]|uniref:hypothetical protein n=1 Tax=Oceanobacillus sp. FSL H7-0719 TaxID=2954507 RepID=UPI0032479F05